MNQKTVKDLLNFLNIPIGITRYDKDYVLLEENAYRINAEDLIEIFNDPEKFEILIKKVKNRAFI